MGRVGERAAALTPMIEHVNELPPDLARLRVVETYLLVQLRYVREAIRRVEQGERQERADGERARRRAAADARLRSRRQSEAEALASGDPGDRPAGPGRAPRRIPSGDMNMKWWHVEPAATDGPAPHPAYLHRGDCPRYRTQGRPGFARDEARAALFDERGGVPTLQPCPHCRPDFGLA